MKFWWLFMRALLRDLFPNLLCPFYGPILTFCYLFGHHVLVVCFFYGLCCFLRFLKLSILDSESPKPYAAENEFYFHFKYTSCYLKLCFSKISFCLFLAIYFLFLGRLVLCYMMKPQYKKKRKSSDNVTRIGGGVGPTETIIRG